MSSSDSYESLQLLWLQALLEVHLDSMLQQTPCPWTMLWKEISSSQSRL